MTIWIDVVPSLSPRLTTVFALLDSSNGALMVKLPAILEVFAIRRLTDRLVIPWQILS
jgi:hypothetical protein